MISQEQADQQRRELEQARVQIEEINRELFAVRAELGDLKERHKLPTIDDRTEAEDHKRIGVLARELSQARQDLEIARQQEVTLRQELEGAKQQKLALQQEQQRAAKLNQELAAARQELEGAKQRSTLASKEITDAAQARLGEQSKLQAEERKRADALAQELAAARQELEGAKQRSTLASKEILEANPSRRGATHSLQLGINASRPLSRKPLLTNQNRAQQGAGGNTPGSLLAKADASGKFPTETGKDGNLPEVEAQNRNYRRTLRVEARNLRYARDHDEADSRSISTPRPPKAIPLLPRALRPAAGT
jgi:predicted  nucleic acid-binding Zn-ribbon protein